MRCALHVLAVLAVACSGDHGSATLEADSSEAVPDGNETNEVAEDAGEVAEAGDADAETAGADAEPTLHQRELAPLAAGSLRAAVSMDFFDVPVGIPMAGYGNRQGPLRSPWSDLFKASRGFYGHQTVKALALEVDGQRLVLLKFPMMSSESGVLDEIHRKLIRDHDLDLSGRVITAATHSHAAPGRYWRLPSVMGLIGTDTPDHELIERISTQFAAVIADAVGRLAPAEWGFTYLDDWDAADAIYRDRRGENTYPKDPRLTLLAVRRLDGTPLACVINFGLHGTVFGQDNDLLSEDAVGGIELGFEGHFFQETGQPIVALFAQSGGGDASPAGDALGHPAPARIERLGKLAAPKIMAAYTGISYSADTTLGVRSRRIDLRHDRIYGDSDAFGGVDGPYAWGSVQCQIDYDAAEDTSSYECTPIGLVAESLGVPLPNAEAHQTFMTVARLGDLLLVSIPGEPAYSTIKYLRDEVAARDAGVDVMAIGYSQDHLLYFTHPDDWRTGGYEAEFSFWGPWGGKYIIDRQLELVDDLLGGYNAPTLYQESDNLLPPLAEVERRAIEATTDALVIDRDWPPSAVRGETVRFAFVGGDPNLGPPLAVLQRQADDGSFADVPSPAGHATGMGNARFAVVSHYRPTPEPTGEILATRRHRWLFDWQIPHDFVARTYRLTVRGRHADGLGEVVAYEVHSKPLRVRPHAAAPHAARTGDALHVRWEVPTPSYVVESGLTSPEAGYRLADADRPPAANARITAATELWVRGLDDSVEVRLAAEFDPAMDVHRASLSGTPLAGAPAVVAVRRVGDVDDAWVEATLDVAR